MSPAAPSTIPLPDPRPLNVRYPILDYFTWEHLPPNLQEISRPLGELAIGLAGTLPNSAELSAGLRKLLEAKDCFVRAALKKPASPKDGML